MKYSHKAVDFTEKVVAFLLMAMYRGVSGNRAPDTRCVQEKRVGIRRYGRRDTHSR